MDKLLQKIRDLESEAQSLIEQQAAKECAPSPSPVFQVQPSLPKWTVRRFSPRLSAAGFRKFDILQEDGYQSSPEPKEQEATQIFEEPFEGSGDGDWMTAFKNEAGRWTGKKLVVLSLFDGIGGVWASLTRLEIPFVGYSSEVSAPAVEVVKTRFPEVQHVGDVRKLERSAIREKVVDLIVGGFPCQDLSCMGKREGLHGHRSRLFFDLLRAMKIFQPKWFLVENVASMTWIDRVEISKYLGVQPLELDSIELTPTRRRRLYWTNIPHPPRMPRVRDHPSTLVQSCLQNAIALEEKTGVILGYTTDESNSCQLERAWEEKTQGLRKVVQAEVERMLGFLPNHTDVMVQEGYNNYRAHIIHCQLELVMENRTNSLRYISHFELELLMGYPPHHTSVLVNEGANSQNSLVCLTKDKNSKTSSKQGNQKSSQGYCENNIRKEPVRAAVRWLMLGNTFSVPVIAYLLSPLLQSSVRGFSQPAHISTSILEKDCSVMEVDDVWALYNEHERPNWYALIVKRSGDRFSRKPATFAKKQPLCIEMQYLEITPAYLGDEEDVWNPLRGTGLYETRQAIDVQDSWTAFSHRVTSFIRMDNKVFIFPGRDEVWTVYCQKIWSPFFVYVMESTINIESQESASPGAEGFFARCYLIVKTGEHETYRRTTKVLEFTDLSLFCFQVPYTFKQEANLLKVEIGTGGRKQKRIESRIRRNKRKREKSSEEYLSEEEELEEDEGLAEEGEAFNRLPKDAAGLTCHVAAREELEFEIDLTDQHNGVVPTTDDTEEESDPEFGTFPQDTIIIDDD